MAQQYRDVDFLVTPTSRITYEEVDRRSQLVAKSLIARGCGKGSRIGFVFANTPDFLVTWLAVTRIGAVALPFSTLYRPAELRQVLRLSDAQILVVPRQLSGQDEVAFLKAALPELAGSVQPLHLSDAPYLRSVLMVGEDTPRWAESFNLAHLPDSDISDDFLFALENEVHPSDPMVTVFTSGTTAEPKAVIHSHGTWVRHNHNVVENIEEPYSQRIYGGMPFFWIGGLTSTIGTAMQRGHTILSAERQDPEAIAELMVNESCTAVMMWPSLHERVFEVLRSGRWDETKLPPVAKAGGGMPAGDPRRIAQSLGMTETCANYIVSGPKAHRIPDEYLGAHGFQVPYMQYRIADPSTGETLPERTEGEICVRGYALMLGLHRRERHEYLDDDGWYHTGDKGALAGPYIYFAGRLKDLIKSSGANVSPREVEAALGGCPGVLTCVVTGIPDPVREEIVGALVVPRSGFTLTAKDVVAHCKEVLSPYKVPRKVLIADGDQVPLLATGKTDLARVKQLVSEQGIPS